MTMTDPIADFLTRLRNANSAFHDEVVLPHSKIKANIAEILKNEGYITAAPQSRPATAGALESDFRRPGGDAHQSVAGSAQGAGL